VIHRLSFYRIAAASSRQESDEVLSSGKLCVSRVMRGAIGMRFTGLFRFATMRELRSQKP
jgi:hypothetical protein